MSQENVEFSKTYLIERAERLIEGLNIQDISSSVVRNLLEIANRSECFVEFKLRAGYLAARHSKKERATVVSLYNRIIEVASQVPEDRRLQFVRELIEQLVMVREVKAMELGVE